MYCTSRILLHVSKAKIAIHYVSYIIIRIFVTTKIILATVLLTGLLIIEQYWYWCDSISDTLLILPRVLAILLMRSIANGIANTDE